MRKVLVLATASLLMTSCVIDKREMVSAVDKYNEEFVNVFGKTDPNHTWSMVENKKVEVNLTKPSNVKVYVKSGENYHLAADYQNVSGSQQLSFDAPMGCKDVYVTVDGVPYQAAGSRTSMIPSGNTVISVGNEYEEYTFGQIKGFFDDKEKLPERQDNTKKVNMDYIAKAEEGKTYTFYPLFWNAYFSHTFGLYYYVGETKYEVDFYKDKEGDELQYYNAKSTSDDKWENVEDNYVFSYFKNKNQLFADEDPVLRCKPFTINFPNGTEEFGFYVNVYEPGQTTPRATYYSNPKLNGANSISSFAYLVVGGNTYITIEDHDNDDFDYNDFIFVMEGTQNHITNDPVEYIYAVEDLGNTDDFDFNDVVFSVSHVSGQPHANVKLLAAGGTLPAYISFNGTSCGGEVHARFKDSAGNPISSNVMVNTAEGTNKANMKQTSPFVVQVPTNWSHAAFSKEGNGFGVKVEKDGAITEVKTPGPGNNAAPQILILPKDWLWPTERTRIDAAYSKFGEWGENYTSTTWVNTYNNGSVVNWIN